MSSQFSMSTLLKATSEWACSRISMQVKFLSKNLALLFEILTQCNKFPVPSKMLGTSSLDQETALSKTLTQYQPSGLLASEICFKHAKQKNRSYQPHIVRHTSLYFDAALPTQRNFSGLFGFDTGLCDKNQSFPKQPFDSFKIFSNPFTCVYWLLIQNIKLWLFFKSSNE